MLFKDKALWILPLVSIVFACNHHHRHQHGSDEDDNMDDHERFVLKCRLENNEERYILQKLILDHDLDLWSEGIPRAPADVTLLVEPDQVDLVMANIACHTPKSMVQYNLEKSIIGRRNKTDGVSGFFGAYQGYQTIINEVQAQAKKYPSLVKKFGSLGKTVEGRSIPVIHLCSNATATLNRKLIWVSGGQHAREWVAVSSVMYILDSLLKNYGINANTTFFLDNFEIAIAPIINPDGYEYSRTRDRYWRKNRRRNMNGSYGVDLNRNWDEHWAEVGSSNIPSSPIYQGRSAASEPEVSQTATYIKSLRNRVAGIDVHSFGQLVLRNYGWTTMATNKEAYLKRLGDGIAAAMNVPYKSDYNSERSSGLYPTGGSMDDWMFDKAGMPGFTIELRDHGEYGFDLPAEFIVPTGEELLAGVLALGQGILEAEAEKMLERQL